MAEDMTVIYFSQNKEKLLKKKDKDIIKIEISSRKKITIKIKEPSLSV